MSDKQVSVAVVGSVNLDMRSLWLNYEVALFVYDAGFAKALRAVQQGYIDDADRLDPRIARGEHLRHGLQPVGTSHVDLLSRKLFDGSQIADAQTVLRA